MVGLSPYISVSEESCIKIAVGVADRDQRVLCDPVTVNHSGLPAALNSEQRHCPWQNKLEESSWMRIQSVRHMGDE